MRFGTHLKRKASNIVSYRDVSNLPSIQNGGHFSKWPPSIIQIHTNHINNRSFSINKYLYASILHLNCFSYHLVIQNDATFIVDF